jgi:hypothetical protein
MHAWEMPYHGVLLDNLLNFLIMAIESYSLMNLYFAAEQMGETRKDAELA